jgi:DNA-binding transcriptional MerR regulator
MNILDIAEVARRSGVPASTLRFYEERSLVAPIGRRGARRIFDEGIFERLALIALGQAAGFSLEEIAGIIATADPLHIDRSRLKAKADELDIKIRQLKAMRDGLRHAAECPAPSHLECPQFQRMVRLAGARRLRELRPTAAKASARTVRRAPTFAD